MPPAEVFVSQIDDGEGMLINRLKPGTRSALMYNLLKRLNKFRADEEARAQLLSDAERAIAKQREKESLKEHDLVQHNIQRVTDHPEEFSQAAIAARAQAISAEHAEKCLRAQRVKQQLQEEWAAQVLTRSKMCASVNVCTCMLTDLCCAGLRAGAG